MDKSKRGFLKVAGSSVLGVLGMACVDGSGIALREIKTALGSKALRASRWAMAVDLKKCLQEDGCEACIEACHVAHNVPSISEKSEEVKWIWKEAYEDSFPTQAHQYTQSALRDQRVLVFCNHCDSPPCVRVCPTQATWKREDGIVMMDQHRCIGCRYCMVACPYGSRSFNWQDPRPFIEGEIDPIFPTRTKGVVEKCNFCAERLAAGKLPACVEACQKNGAKALVFGDLEDPNSEIAELLGERYSIRRKPGLGTDPKVYYSV
jgi:molybdopterin-containing oxidoreductase family iron-sulfur binding subunit